MIQSVKFYAKPASPTGLAKRLPVVARAPRQQLNQQARLPLSDSCPVTGQSIF